MSNLKKVTEYEMLDILAKEKEASKNSVAMSMRLQDQFNLTYLNIGEFSITAENDFWSARYSSYNDPKLTVNPKCEIDAKDITTFEQFQEAKQASEQARYEIMYAIYWIAFRVIK